MSNLMRMTMISASLLCVTAAKAASLTMVWGRFGVCTTIAYSNDGNGTTGKTVVEGPCRITGIWVVAMKVAPVGTNQISVLDGNRRPQRSDSPQYQYANGLISALRSEQTRRTDVSLPPAHAVVLFEGAKRLPTLTILLPPRTLPAAVQEQALKGFVDWDHGCFPLDHWDGHGCVHFPSFPSPSADR